MSTALDLSGGATLRNAVSALNRLGLCEKRGRDLRLNPSMNRMTNMEKTSKQIVEEAITRCVWIRWLDACGGSGWADAAAKLGDLKPDIIDTVGFIVKETDDAISVASQMDITRGGIDQYMTIPRPYILDMWEIA